MGHVRAHMGGDVLTLSRRQAGVEKLEPRQSADSGNKPERGKEEGGGQLHRGPVASICHSRSSTTLSASLAEPLETKPFSVLRVHCWRESVAPTKKRPPVLRPRPCRGQTSARLGFRINFPLAFKYVCLSRPPCLWLPDPRRPD